jgi:two-component system nitrate/nitrite response regulator NarL
MNDLLAKLSERQQQVVALVCEGLSNKMIAQKLNVSEGTIKTHLHAIFIKLRLQSRLALLVALDRTLSDEARGLR